MILRNRLTRAHSATFTGHDDLCPENNFSEERKLMETKVSYSDEYKHIEYDDDDVELNVLGSLSG